MDIVILGLNGQLFIFLILQTAKTLPEAYAMRMGIQSLDFRNTPLHPYARNQISVPISRMLRVEGNPEL